MMGTWRGSLERKWPRLRQRVVAARSTSATTTVPHSEAGLEDRVVPARHHALFDLAVG